MIQIMSYSNDLGHLEWTKDLEANMLIFIIPSTFLSVFATSRLLQV